ncbi:ACT domain-containing protein [Photobacterium galatheae]|uniref:Transporter n=1 Tax=Photobacterium galatheae TaxID=1654360 RepID=A0A066S0E8_9GAMM|nr:ACT domain-containing protein [Photobacterium galatheae]KDM93422.1 transporter [Photobacterium galatheae]MCM0147002.1 ACT domain-containing protein [Photobacterium galatheae]
MSGMTDLQELLRSMSPQLQPEAYVFCCVEGDMADYLALSPIATFREREGLTLVVTQSAAETIGVTIETTFRCITLTVHSSLEAVGLTAAVSTVLAEHGISANVIAAYYHDHIFVPAGKADQAVAILTALANQSSGNQD